MGNPAEDEVLTLPRLRKSKKVVLLTEANVPEDYILREFDGATRDLYMMQLSRKVTTRADGQTVTSNFSGTFSSLIKLCLFKVEESKELIVKEEDIQAYPSTTQEALFKECQRLCGLGKNARDDAKNE